MNENDLFRLSLIGERHANSMLISIALAMATKDSEEKLAVLRSILLQLKSDWPSGLSERYPDLPKEFLDVIAKAFSSQIDSVLSTTEVTASAMDEAADTSVH